MIDTVSPPRRLHESLLIPTNQSWSEREISSSSTIKWRSVSRSTYLFTVDTFYTDEYDSPRRTVVVSGNISNRSLRRVWSHRRAARA